MKSSTIKSWACMLMAFVIGLHAAEKKDAPSQADLDHLVTETHGASLKLRDEALRKTVAKDTCWPPGIWGNNLWCLAALYRNEKVDVANARLLQQARDFIDRTGKGERIAAPTPEQPGNAPWTFFSITDYVRTLCLFHAKSTHFPGRLSPEAEAAMKQALWIWISGESRIAEAEPGDLFQLLGTENHDLNKRPNHYLIAAVLKEDPAYKDRKLADGHTVSEHAEAYTTFFREWPRSRAKSGLWVEVGSSTYQKYSWPALFNLHELAPDRVIRHRFGQLLDLAFIEEAQIAVQGRRGGGRSRAEYDANAFEAYQNLLYACAGAPAGSSHSRVIETSRYQLPSEAILLRKRIFPAAEPFVIENRVLGELEVSPSDDTGGQRLAADSALVNYAYRTPTYLLGSTLQNPALPVTDPETGAQDLKYAGITRQKRTCGLLFDDPSAKTVSQVHPVVEHTGGGRSQHSFWSVQHENVLLLQRIARHGKSTFGSYNTGKLGMRFEGDDLEKVEEDGWIFASNGKAFVGVRFLDGGHQWDAKRVEANPTNVTGAGETARIVLHAGDATSHGSFERFRETVRAQQLTVTADEVDFRSGTNRIEWFRYVSSSPATFALPRINGKPVDLRPSFTYRSPYLNGAFGSDRVTVSIGPLTRVLDFSE